VGSEKEQIGKLKTGDFVVQAVQLNLRWGERRKKLGFQWAEISLGAELWYGASHPENFLI
jgi:hypothetical protein